MGDAIEEQISREGKPARSRGGGWQLLWFLLHLATIYALVKFLTPWLAGWTAGRLLPLLQHPTSSGPFQFFFSHLFAFSFIPAFLGGLINARFKHKAAQFVWLVPAFILAYKFVTFPAASVFASQFSSAFHQYFGGGFLLSGSWASHDLPPDAGSLDNLRGMAQFQFTAPFYAGVGYSVAAWIGRRTDLNRKFAEKMATFEDARFDHPQ